MGYYSSFEIAVEGIDEEAKLAEILSVLEDVSGGYRFMTYGDVIVSDDSYKWYGHREDLVELSKDYYPDLTFQLRAVGEDGDRWIVVARNGKSYREDVAPAWPDVDESRLA